MDGGADRGRVTADLVALYELEEGSGTIVHDTSPGAPLDLVIEAPGDAVWVTGGLAFERASVVRSPGAATKIIGACKKSNAVTLEAWVTYGATQPQWGRPVNIIAPDAPETFNAALAIINNQTDFGIRTTTSTAWPVIYSFGSPLLAGRHHVVGIRGPSGGTRLFVDGVERQSATHAGDFSNWDDTYRLILGNAATLDRSWLGTIHLVAAYSRALATNEVKQNFAAGADP